MRGHALRWVVVTLVAVVGLPTGLASRGPPRGPNAFLAVDGSSRPARWDPCRTVRVRVAAASAPGDAVTVLHDALSRLATATGLRFEIIGGTAWTPALDPLLTRPTDADLVVAWASPLDVRDLTGPVAARAWVRWRQRGGRLEIVAADVIIDSGLWYLDQGFGTARSWGGVLLHELGHAVGLADQDDPARLMHPHLGEVTVAAAYQPKDSDALGQVGAAASCFEPRSSFVPTAAAYSSASGRSTVVGPKTTGSTSCQPGS